MSAESTNLMDMSKDHKVMYMMPMWLSNGSDLLLLFEGFESKQGDYVTYTALLGFVVALAFSIEALNYWRQRVHFEAWKCKCMNRNNEVGGAGFSSD